MMQAEPAHLVTKATEIKVSVSTPKRAKKAAKNRCAYSAVTVHCKKSCVLTVWQLEIPWVCSQRCTTFWVSSEGRTREATSCRLRCLPAEDGAFVSWFIVKVKETESELKCWVIRGLPYWSESGSDTRLRVSSSRSTFCCFRAKVSSSCSEGSTRPAWVQSCGRLKNEKS